MSARVFIHPACMRTPADTQALANGLVSLGYAVDAFKVYDLPGKSATHELARDIGPVPGGHVYERMDGVQFVQRNPFACGPEVA